MDWGQALSGFDNRSFHIRIAPSVMSTTLPFASATVQAAWIREGATTSASLTEAHLARIRQHNTALNAIVVSNEAGAQAEARNHDAEREQGMASGPLHGVPVTVKESYNLAGFPTTVNFPQLEGNIATTDAFVVSRLRAAGAIILGKTNIPTMLGDFQSFGPLYPTAANPYDTTRTPGGSTGGGAAALAAGLTSLEFGSDIGGSIRLPAHFCGLFGLKPTENALKHGEGHVPPAPGARGGVVHMASMGPLARTMADIELAWTVINAPTWHYLRHMPQRPPTNRLLGDYRIGWFTRAGPIEAGDDTKAVLRTFLQRLEGAGVACEERRLPETWWNAAYDVWGAIFGTMMGQDAPWIARQFMKRQFAAMGRGALMQGAAALRRALGMNLVDFARALGRRTALIEELNRQFDDVDFLVSPVAAGPAFAHNPKHEPIAFEGRSEAYMDYVAPFTIAYNTCGNPVLVVPAGRSPEGLPIGLQIAAAQYAEPELLRFGRLVEALGAASFVPPAGY